MRYFPIAILSFALVHAASIRNNPLSEKYPLMEAVCLGDEWNVQTLLNRGADINFVNEDQQAALTSAIECYAGSDMIMMLLRRHADLNVRDSSNATPLIIAARLKQYDTVVQLVLFRTGSEIDINAKDDDGNTALHYAVLNNDYLMAKTLVRFGSDMFTKNLNDQSAFELTAYSGNQKMMQIFLRYQELVEWTL